MQERIEKKEREKEGERKGCWGFGVWVLGCWRASII